MSDYFGPRVPNIPFTANNSIQALGQLNSGDEVPASRPDQQNLLEFERETSVSARKLNTRQSKTEAEHVRPTRPKKDYASRVTEDEDDAAEDHSGELQKRMPANYGSQGVPESWCN